MGLVDECVYSFWMGQSHYTPGVPVNQLTAPVIANPDLMLPKSVAPRCVMQPTCVWCLTWAGRSCAGARAGGTLPSSSR